MKMNYRSVMSSGIVAGLTIVILGLALIPVVGSDMDRVLTDAGLPALSSGAMIYFGIMALLLGVFVVWLYAAILPHYGPGLKTATIASSVIWFFTYFWSNASMVAYGFMPVRITVIGTLWELVELVVAGVVGARLYKEDE